MRPTIKHTYAKNEVTQWPVPNYWDVIALVLVVAIVCLLGLGAHALTGRFYFGETVAISLAPWHLPYYALLTVLRMLIAMVCSLLFAFIFATWAAKSRQAERIIIPMIDILQSVPVLGFLSITVVGFIVLFRGSMLGPECAAIFAIFVAQAWNIALSFYQSLKMLPHDLHEASAMLQLSAWQKFWRIEVPFAMPGLIWNMMLSMSGSWIFLVASEAISIGNYHIYLSGVGSYIAMAIEQKNLPAIGYVIATMFIVIILIDQVLFRPLVAWSEKFKMTETTHEDEPESWLLNLFQRTRFMRFTANYWTVLITALINFKWFRHRARFYKSRTRFSPQLQRAIVAIWNILLFVIIIAALVILIRFILIGVPAREFSVAAYDGLITSMRVVAAIIVSSLVWIPIGVWIGLRPKASQIIQPIAQIMAAFPMNLVFPLVVWVILRYDLNVNIWLSPLMIMGSQWYILFNVIAGTAALPRNLHHAVGTLNVHGWLWWRRFILPGIFPYYITGAITAAGNAWNVSILAEAVSWGSTHLWATGLGAYIVRASDSMNFYRLSLGIVMMSVYVLIFNRFIWRPLYRLAQSRYMLR